MDISINITLDLVVNVASTLTLLAASVLAVEIAPKFAGRRRRKRGRRGG